MNESLSTRPLSLRGIKPLMLHWWSTLASVSKQQSSVAYLGQINQSVRIILQFPLLQLHVSKTGKKIKPITPSRFGLLHPWLFKIGDVTKIVGGH